MIICGELCKSVSHIVFLSVYTAPPAQLHPNFYITYINYYKLYKNRTNLPVIGSIFYLELPISEDEAGLLIWETAPCTRFGSPPGVVFSV
jgi:hypothetical protein